MFLRVEGRTPDEYLLVRPNISATDKTMVFDKLARDLSACTPGAVFAVRLTEQGISYRRKALPAGYVSDAVRAVWQAAHQANKLLLDARRADEKEGDRNLVKERCELLRRMYDQCHTGMAKQQFLAQVVFYVTRPK